MRRQPELLRGEVDLSIGVVDGDDRYAFGEVVGLAGDARGRIYVADSTTVDVRVFDSDGTFLFRMGGEGQGPGEFHVNLCGLRFDPEGRLWVVGRTAYSIFSITDDGASYVGRQLVPGRYFTRCVLPMFAGSTGLTLVDARFTADLRVIYEHVQVAANDEVKGRVRIPPSSPDWGEWSWPRLVTRDPRGAPLEIPIEPPFAAQRPVAHGPDAGFAYVFTPEYDIRVHRPDGRLKVRIKRDIAGPPVTEGEAAREDERMAKERARFQRLEGEFPNYRMPVRKPPIRHIWYDEDGRLWVLLWPAESDDRYRAHVYDGGGGTLFEAEWSRGIAISRGGVSGKIALGIQRIEFDVPRVVRLRFIPVEEGNGEA